MKISFLAALVIFFFIGIPKGIAQKIPKKAKKLYEDGKLAAGSRKFDRGIDYLKKSVNIAPDFAEAHRELAYYFFVLRDLPNARIHYQKAADLKPAERAFAAAYIRLAEFYINEGGYDNALKYAETYLEMQPSARYINDIKLAKEIIKSASFAVEAKNKAMKFEPVPLPGMVNKLQQQYFPTLTADEQTMIFTGRNGNNEDIFEVLKQDGIWQQPKVIDELSTKNNEGTCSISADGKTLIFTACEGNKDRQVYGACDLFISYKTGEEWSKPVNMGRNINTKAWESQPSLSADGRAIYFISDRGGGVGKNDIWMSQKDKEGNWLPSVNLGKPINTELNEVSPFIHANGNTLFFSSKGHAGFWGYDLYSSEMKEDDTWEQPENLGYPLNDYNDQVSLFIAANGKTGYYSHEERQANQQIKSTLQRFDIPEEIRIKKRSDVVKGKVYDKNTQKVLDAEIELTDIESKKVIAEVSSDAVNGKYMIVLTEGAEYALHINKEGYLYKSLTFNYKEQQQSQAIELDIPLEPIAVGSKVILNNIFFESGSFALLDKSQTELDKLVTFMRENPSIKIDIEGHTDDVGGKEANKTLSQKRAGSVVEYITKTGIDNARLKATGYGEEKPVAPNNSPENRALNRRIEFTIL